ncbi:thiamine pyrophosphokinase 1-like [Babylonia areolata]|uniref:thiamine pyrophosphokinase 1-like n=1 Tax=Babylonia areolata TaxID=304850 RepID=UPI003FD2F307
MEAEAVRRKMQVLRPLACLQSDAEKNAALVVLNQPLEKNLLKQLWGCSVFRAVTDGGIDRLMSCVEAEKDLYIPDVITGDFDSASKSALEYYAQKSVPKIHTPDQDETDFTKCLRIAIEKTRSLPVKEYLVVGTFGGRLDQQFANFHTLFTAATLTDRPVYLISQGSLACLLPPGKTTIHADTGLEESWCGLIPIGCRCDHVTTSGLKWNLDDQPLGFGELISTSNAYSSQVVTVETDRPLIWTMGYNSVELS